MSVNSAAPFYREGSYQNDNIYLCLKPSVTQIMRALIIVKVYFDMPLRKHGHTKQSYII